MAPAVVLVGAPGSGKTTIGRGLAEALGGPFRDTDEDIAAAAGMSVQDIFVLEGEDGFRARERAAVLAALTDDGSVLAVGGGAVESEQVREALAGLPVVWLQVEAGEAVGRVGLSGPRPVLLGNVRARWSALLDSRRPWYDDVARWRVDTTEQDPADTVEEIVEHLRADHG